MPVPGWGRWTEPQKPGGKGKPSFSRAGARIRGFSQETSQRPLHSALCQVGREPRSRLGSVLRGQAPLQLFWKPVHIQWTSKRCTEQPKAYRWQRWRCPLPEKFRNCARGQVTPETKETASIRKLKKKGKKSWMKSRAPIPLCGSCMGCSKTLHSSTFYVFLCYLPLRTTSRISGRPSFLVCWH